MYEFLYDYIKPKYGDKAKLCYMDSFIIHIKTEDFYKDIANGVDKWFDTSSYNETDKRPLPIRINKKVLGMFKDELNRKIMIKFCGPRAKTCSFLSDEGIENKKAKGTKKGVIRWHLKFDNHKASIFNDKNILRTQQRLKSDLHTIYTENINKIVISSNDDKRLQTHNKITTYPYRTNAFKVCKCKMLSLLLISLKK